MLLNFSVSNFGSFNEKATFSLFPGKISKQHPNHVLENKSFSSLKGAAIYGANASGKSNFVKAIQALQACVMMDNTKFILANQFKLAKSLFCTEFTIDFQINEIAYRYSLVTNGIEIPLEQLSILQKNGKIKPLFTRKLSEIELGNLLDKSSAWYKNRTFQAATTFLFKLRQDGIVENSTKLSGADHIVNAFTFFEQLFVTTPKSFVNPVAFGMYFNQHDFQNFLKKLLKIADLGISDIKWIPLSKEETEAHFRMSAASGQPQTFGTLFSINSEGDMVAIDINFHEKKGLALRTIHNGIAFRIQEESDGTKRLIDLALSFFLLRNPNTCLVIDELDCRLHPFLSKFLIQEHMENDKQKGQLIVTLHDLNLMTNEIWRTDEIWFTEKRQDGSTDLYSLYQFSPRFDKNLQKGYIQGKYGAIPMIGDWNNE